MPLEQRVDAPDEAVDAPAPTRGTPSRAARMLAALAPLAPLAAALFSVVLAVVLFGQGGQDDAYITYWPARTLAERGQILNYNGVRLEQSSSLSLVVVLALLHALTRVSVPTLGFLTSLAGGVATILLATRLARRMGLASSGTLALAIGTVASFGYWATSGMESTLFTAAAFWLIDELARPAVPERPRAWTRLFGAGLLFAAARPEAPLVAVGLAAVSVISAVSARAHRGEARAAAARAAATVVAVGSVFGFRRLYFRAWWPNPATIKAGGFDPEAGARYLWDAVVAGGALPVVLFLAGVATLIARRVRGGASRTGEMVAAFALAELAFVVVSGGDWMTGARFFAPIVPAIVLAGFVALEAVATRPSLRRSAAGVVVAMNLVFAVQLLHRGESDGQPLWTMSGVFRQFDRHVGPHEFARVELLNKLHRRDAVTISALLPIADAVVAQAGSRPVYAMSGQAGMIAYHLMSRHFGRIKLLDVWSLTTRDLLDCLPAGSVGSGKWGTWIGTERPLRDHEEITRRCGLPLPDIVYNEALEAHLPKYFDRLGYDVLYRQVGSVKNSVADGFFQAGVIADGYVAARHELAAAAGLKKQPIWTWDMVPR